MQNVRTDFTPSLHGFSFRNRFPGQPLPSFISKFPGISKILSNSQSYHGLCGGMCFATYDFFLAKRTISSDNAVPEPGTPLYCYLDQRQIDTYGPCGKFIAKFALWTALPDSRVQKLTSNELEKVITQLDSGQAVILGLVYVSIVDTLAIWLNHQVLAYSYSGDPKSINIKIYDPELPRRDDVVIEIKRESAGFQCKQKVCNVNREARVRGFFVIPYIPVEPPIHLS